MKVSLSFIGDFPSYWNSFSQYWKEKLFYYLAWKTVRVLTNSLDLPTKSLINVCPSSFLSSLTRAWWIATSSKHLFFSFVASLFRFKLTTRKFAVIVNHAAQESIYRVYVCHQTQRHNQLPRWDSTLNNRERNRRGFATVMVLLSTHKETVFHLVQLAATRHQAATTLNNTSQFQWPRQVSFVSRTEKVFPLIH